VAKGLPKQPEKKGHHAALPFQELPEFVATIRGSDASAIIKLAFEFLILTATRTKEVRGATWDEIDLERKVRCIPAKRMKAGRDHRVPLSERCIEVLVNAQEIGCCERYVFPSPSGSKPLSDMAFLMLLRRMKAAITAHGFRSTFRDWAAERTHFPRDACEMALAHAIKDKLPIVVVTCSRNGAL
jgi:integrase